MPNVSAGGGIPGTTSVGSALPGLSYSPFANAGSPYALGGSSGSIGSPVGTATPGGSGGTGLSPFLEGSIFNQLFPSGVNPATPTGAPSLGGGALNMGAAPSGTANLLNMAAPTGGEVQPGGGGSDPSIGQADPGESGAVNDGGVAAATGSNILSGMNQGFLSQGLNALNANVGLNVANGNPSLSTNSGQPGFNFNLSNLMGLLGTMFAGPMFGLANAAGGGLASGLQGLSTRSGDFSGPLGGLFGNATPSAATNYAGFNNSLSDVGRTGEISGPFTGAGNPSIGTAAPGPNSFLGSLMSAIQAANEGLSFNTSLDASGQPGMGPGNPGGGLSGGSLGNPGAAAPGAIGFNFSLNGAPGQNISGLGARSDPDAGPAPTAPAPTAGFPGEAMGEPGGPNAPGPPGAGFPGESMGEPGGPGGVASAPGDGGDGGDGGSLLCTYCLGNGSYDAKTSDGHRKVFGGLAGRALKDPAMKESFGHYQQASRQILDKIDTLDGPRRKAQLTDLHENLVKPFHAAAMRKDVKGAARILRDQTVRLAQTHGVTIPPEHLAAANKALGGGIDDGTAGA